MAPSRVVVVVPRHEVELHAYLQRSLAFVEGVDVVLDRRTAGAGPRARDERRRPASERAERQVFICSIVRSPATPALDAEAPAAGPEIPAGGHRTLLWPALRLDHLCGSR